MATNLVVLANIVITAYCCTGHSCANGRYPKQGQTCAASRSIPLGSVVKIDGVGIRVVEDRLNKRFDKRIDIYFDNKADCIQFGKQKHNITIITKP